MNEQTEITSSRSTAAAPQPADLVEQYGCGPIRFSGDNDALYERHLLFDDVVDPLAAGGRERFEAAARSVRDVLSQRWVRTERTYNRLNPKRIYYLSMEFLIGRSLANNVTNMLIEPFVHRATRDRDLDWLGLIEEEPDAGLGNGGLGRLAACFLDSMATMQLPAMGYGLRYEYGMFRQSIADGWQREHPDNWLRQDDPWEVARPREAVEIRLSSSINMHHGSPEVVPGRPSTLIGIPYDRPVVGYGGETVNTLRLWSATASEGFDFQRFSGGDFVASIAEALNAESLTRVLYPDDHTVQGRELRLMQEYFLVACSLGDIVRRFRQSNSDWRTLPDKAAIQMNDTHPTLAAPELMRILLDDAHLGWDEAFDLTKRTLAYTNHTLLPEALERWPAEWMQFLIPRHLEIIYEINRRLMDDIRARFPGDDGRAARISLVEEGQTKHIRMANLGRFAQHQRRGGDPFQASARDDGPRPRGGLPRAFQQQDERGDAEALAPARQSASRRDDLRRHRRRLDHRPQPIERAASACRRRGFPGENSRSQTRGQGEVRRLGQAAHGGCRRSGHDLRLPDQAHSRIQAAAAERSQSRRSLRSAA